MKPIENKVLVLGGKPIGSVEITKRLKERGAYTVVTDFLPSDLSFAKKIADESWMDSTADIDGLSRKISEHSITGITTGVHEFNINRMLDLCKKLSLPCYCSRETWKYCDNKADFKALCRQNGIPVATTHTLDEVIRSSGDEFPLIVKPVDGSGSRGFHICNNISELSEYYDKAKDFSPSGTVLIEDYIPYNAVIIHYTMINGQCIYSGMSDKVSVRFKNTGASVMGIQTFPSKGETAYLETLDGAVRKMFENAGFQEGPIWIEAFYDGNDRFIFNEMGYRFGGSLTYYPVKYFTGIDQLDLLLDNALNISHETFEIPNKPVVSKNYCILPIHIKAGVISQIIESEALHNNPDIYAMVPVHFRGDEIKEWGSAQQVYAYIHILYNENRDLKDSVQFLFDNLKVLDETGENMIYSLFDINTLQI